MANIGQELLNVPFAEMTQKLAFAIAEGQTKLDLNSARVAKAMSETKIDLPRISDPSKTDSYSLMALGFFPGFYQFQSAEIEVSMAISMTKTTETSGSASVKGGWGPVAAQVNAAYSSKYNYSQEGASKLKVKLAPAPPPTLLEKYMEKLIEKQAEALEAAIGDAPSDPAPAPVVEG